LKGVLMKKIVHFSDLHILDSHYKEYKICNKKIVNNKIFEEKAPPDDTIIVITGDLCNCGAYNEYNVKYINNANNFVTDLRDKGYEVFVVPGNHDYSGHFGIFLSQDAATKFRKTFFGTRYDIFPKVDYIESDDKKIALIGLDSMEGYLFKAQGKYIGGWYSCNMCIGLFGEKQLNILKDRFIKDNELKNSDYKVLYFHHNPFYEEYGWNIDDINDLWNVIKSTETKIDLMLFGHDHKFHAEGDVESEYNGYKSIPFCYDASSTTGHIINDRSRINLDALDTLKKESQEPDKNASRVKIPRIRCIDIKNQKLNLIAV